MYVLKAPGDLFADFSRLQERLDDLLGDGQSSSSIRAVARNSAFPSLNMGTWEEALEIYAFAPGLSPDSIDVSVEKGLLTISGERQPNGTQGQDQIVYARERFAGPFRRAFSLPEDADTGKVSATYRNGVLKLVVPRLEAAKARQIAVNG